MWEQLLIVFGGNATLLIVLGFLFRSLISQLLTKDIEKFKTQLKADADKSVEQYKSTLQMTALEHQVRFSKLHEKRAQVIADLYERFVTAYSDTDTYHFWLGAAGSQAYEGQAHEAMKSLEQAYKFFEMSRIYLSESLSLELDNFFHATRNLTQDVEALVRKSDPIVELPSQAEKETLETLRSELPAMRQRLDAEFKKLIEPLCVDLPNSADSWN
jgi:hypothetical protein